jgi:hypothetical protein
MKPKRFPFIFALWIAFLGLLLCGAALALGDGGPENLPILQAWSGDYPISQLNRLPERQRTTSVGYLGTSAEFADVWQAFKPGEKLPEVNFKKQLVVFSRNVNFYNRTSIAKVVLKDGVAEIIAIETRSAMPIEGKVAMAMGAIAREGVKYIQAGSGKIPVFAGEAAVDPLNATYTLEGQKFRLIEGHNETQAVPASATKIETLVFGKPVYGDLDGDGYEDAALVLTHQPGGSGTFYYVAAALNRNSTYRGTNGVLLGDRISPQTIQIRNGVVVANYADRRPDEPMAAPPAVGKTKYLTLKSGQLEEIEPLGQGQQVFEGWVTIGHEVRSFQPCTPKTDLWILGDSPALREIMAAHRQALPDRKRYAPLFMVLAGRYGERPADGFGRESEGAFSASQLVQIWPKGNCKSEYLVLDSPAPGEVVNSPLNIRGRARGLWFFEGDFPLFLKDSSGKVIAKGFATAKGEWMTRDFVPFSGTLEFRKTGAGGKGSLILKKANPADLPEQDDALQILLFFD